MEYTKEIVCKDGAIKTVTFTFTEGIPFEEFRYSQTPEWKYFWKEGIDYLLMRNKDKPC